MRSKQRKARIIELFMAGKLTFAEIGAETGCSGSYVGQVTRGISRPCGRYSSNARRNLQRRKACSRRQEPKPDNVLAAQLVIEDGMSYGAAARELGLTRSAVAGAVDRARRRIEREAR